MAAGSDKAENAQEQARRERLAAALRDNLKRRKAQARARKAGEGAPEPGEGTEGGKAG